MKRTVIWAMVLPACLAFSSGALGSGFNKVGRTSFQFVKIGIGARQTALGEASAALVRDVNSLFWNPANIAGIQWAEASFSYARWFADMNYLSGAVGMRWEGVGVFGLGISSLRYGDLQEALAIGSRSDTRTGNTFTGNDIMFTGGFSHEFSEALSIGASVKYLQENLYSSQASLFAFDVGTYYNTGFKGIRFGMSFQNFGKSVKFLELGDRTEGYEIPLLYRVAVATDLIGGKDGFIDLGTDHRLTLCLESVNSNDYGERWHVGGEYVFNDFLSFRGGYRINYEEGNLSFGVGLAQTIAGRTVRLDYSYVAYEFLESPHRLTLNIGF